MASRTMKYMQSQPASRLHLLCFILLVVGRTYGQHMNGWFSFQMFSTHPDRYSIVQLFALAGVVWLSAPAVTALAAWGIAQDLRTDNL
jgi:hypothetical protein